ncbi:hypothetical protein ABK040_004202 [Willaertia magna]
MGQCFSKGKDNQQGEMNDDHKKYYHDHHSTNKEDNKGTIKEEEDTNNIVDLSNVDISLKGLNQHFMDNYNNLIQLSNNLFCSSNYLFGGENGYLYNYLTKQEYFINESSDILTMDNYNNNYNNYTILGYRDSSIILLNENYQNILTLNHLHSLSITSILFTNKNIISGSRDNFIKVYNLNQNKLINEKYIERNIITKIKYLNLTNEYIQSSEDLSIKCWDLNNMKINEQIKTNDIPTCINCFNNTTINGNYILVGFKGFNKETSKISLYDRRKLSGGCINNYFGHSLTVNDIVCLENYNVENNSDCYFASIGNDRYLNVWNLNEPNRVIKSIQLPYCPMTLQQQYTTIINNENHSIVNDKNIILHYGGLEGMIGQFKF